jgi:hypothetical protein
MRHALANVLFASTLGGCSLVYNPSNIPLVDPDAQPVDAMADAEVVFDADPTMLTLEAVWPKTLVEGQGDGGSRPALLVIQGHHMVPEETSVTLSVSDGEKRTVNVLVDNAALQIDANGRRLAIPVTVPVDEELGAGETVTLDVTVTQDGTFGPVSKTLEGALVLRGLAELDGNAPGGFPAGISEFSRVHITSGTLVAASGATSPVRIRSRSSLTIDTQSSANVSAVGQSPGPGGGAGGMGGAGGLLSGSAGKAGGGPAPGQTSGANASYIGDSQLTTLDNPNRSSGGAGGNGALLGQRGGNGGGGGGSIELTAAGDLTIKDVLARGAAGESRGVANVGGGGSGGIVFLRAGGAVTAGTIDVGGHPTPGRVRIDAGTSVTVAQEGYYRGPMFVSVPLITTEQRPQITVSGGPLTGFRYFIVSEDGADVRGPFDETIANNGLKTLSLAADLYPGLNELCLLVEGAIATSDTRTCIHVAHLYRP